MVTLKQVAAEAGVSPSTASAALRGMDIVRPDTAKKVLETAARFNYQTNLSARALRSGRSDTFTLIIPDLENQYYAKLANSLSYELLTHGKRLIIQVSRYDHEQEFQLIRSINDSICDGLFICSSTSSASDVRQAIGGNYPVVMFDDMSMGAESCYDSIDTPSQAGMYAAIRHLVEDCHRQRIGVLGSKTSSMQPGTLGFTLRQNRCNYAVQALESYGLADEHTMIATDWGFRVGVEVAHRLADEGMRYDALCCMNDELALGVMRGLAECGINVPNQVAVTGFDGVLAGEYITPTLTTIAVDFNGMAQTAIHMMREAAERRSSGAPTLPRRIIVGFQLHKCESTMGRTASTGFTTIAAS